MAKTNLMIVAGMFLLVAVLVVASLVFNPGQHLSTKGLAVIVIGPLLLSGMMIGTNSVQAACWLVKNDRDAVVSCRPLPARIMAGIFGSICVWGAVAFTAFLVSGGLTSQSGGWVAVILSALLLFLLTVTFLFNTGPRRLSLDLQNHRYSFTQGFPLLTWTKHGQTDGGELSLNRVKSGPWQVRFRAPGWKFGLPLEIYMTEDDARSLSSHAKESWYLFSGLVPTCARMSLTLWHRVSKFW